MLGSTLVVSLFPKTSTTIVVLQNSLAATDSTDFIGQLLVDTVFNFNTKNHYVALARRFTPINFNHQRTLKAELERKREPGTTHKPLKAYTGTYSNAIHNFEIEIFENKDLWPELKMGLQGREDEEYVLNHYHYNSLPWLLTHNEAAQRGRVISDFLLQHYLINFMESADG